MAYGGGAPVKALLILNNAHPNNGCGSIEIGGYDCRTFFIHKILDTPLCAWNMFDNNVSFRGGRRAPDADLYSKINGVIM